MDVPTTIGSMTPKQQCLHDRRLELHYARCSQRQPADYRAIRQPDDLRPDGLGGESDGERVGGGFAGPFRRRQRRPASLTLSSSCWELVLNGIDNYSGGTVVEAGTLEVTTAGAIPNGSSLTTVGCVLLIFDSAVKPASPVEASAASVNAVPEPGTLGLLAVGALGLLGYGWRRRGAKT